MTRLLPLVLLLLAGSGAHAENQVSVEANVGSIDVKRSGRNYSYAGREDVQAFVEDLRNRHGFDAGMLIDLFARTKPNAAVIKAIMPPKDPGVRSWHAYRGRFVEPKRIAAGRRFMLTYATELAAAEERFGVPAEIIAAIIGVETIYGKQLGRFHTFAALTTSGLRLPAAGGTVSQGTGRTAAAGPRGRPQPAELYGIVCRRAWLAAVPAILPPAFRRRLRSATAASI